MKKLIAMMLAVLMLACAMPALAEYEVQGGLMTMANPWTDTTPEDIMEQIGVRFNVPEGAQNVKYRMLGSMSVAEMQFEWQELLYVARIQPAYEFADISGVMYANWESVERCQVSWCEGEKKTVADGENRVHVCLWFDAAPGLMYSLTTRTSTAQEYDILTAAEALFVPMQGDANGIDWEYAKVILEGCTGWAGTAGSSLKSAIAACNLLEYCVCDLAAAQMETDVLLQTLAWAYGAMEEERRAELDWSMQTIASVIEKTFAGDEEMAGLLDDAGIAQRMAELTAMEDAYMHWTAFYAQLVNAQTMPVLKPGETILGIEPHPCLLVDAAELRAVMESCTGYAGTAGSSLKGARAACGLLEYCINAQIGYADKDALAQTMTEIYAALSEETRAEFEWNMETISYVIDSALEDYEAQRGLFEAAGIEEAMELLASHDEAYMHWSALYEQIAQMMKAQGE